MIRTMLFCLLLSFGFYANAVNPVIGASQFKDVKKAHLANQNLVNYLLGFYNNQISEDDLRFVMESPYQFEKDVSWFNNLRNAQGFASGSFFHFPVINTHLNEGMAISFAQGMARSFFLYFSLQKFNPPSSFLINEIVLSNGISITDSPSAMCGMIWKNAVLASVSLTDSEGYFMAHKFIRLYMAVLRNSGQQLSKINVRYNQNLMSTTPAIIQLPPNGDAHIFLDYRYTEKYSSPSRNENAHLISATFAKLFLNNALCRFKNHSVLKKIKEFFCKFRLARPFVNLHSDSGSHIYKCHNAELYDDYISEREAGRDFLTKLEQLINNDQ